MEKEGPEISPLRPSFLRAPVRFVVVEQNGFLPFPSVSL